MFFIFTYRLLKTSFLLCHSLTINQHLPLNLLLFALSRLDLLPQTLYLGPKPLTLFYHRPHLTLNNLPALPEFLSLLPDLHLDPLELLLFHHLFVSKKLGLRFHLRHVFFNPYRLSNSRVLGALKLMNCIF